MCKQYTSQKEQFWSSFDLITAEVQMGKYHNTLEFGCEQVKGAGICAPEVEETIQMFNQCVLNGKTEVSRL